MTHDVLKLAVGMLLESEAKVQEELAVLEQEYDDLYYRGIEWKKYDSTSRDIESHIDHLITNDQLILIAQHASITGTGEYSEMINNSLIGWVTHYAKINLPTR